MKDRIEQRLGELRRELEQGYRRMAVLDKEREETRDTILRINGAIHVLEELSQSDCEMASKVRTEDRDSPRVAAG